MSSKPSVFITNFNPRFTGVSATIASVIKVQRKQLEVTLVGRGLKSCPSPSSKLNALTLSKRAPASKPFNIWHVRRNTEMRFALFARDVLRLPIKIVFTSAAQRRHSALPRWLISKMDAVIATTEAAANYVPNVVSVVPHGIDLDYFSPGRNVEDSWLKTGLTGKYGIISVGRVRPEKGTDLFVETMIKALPKLPEATAIIVGTVKKKDIAFKKILTSRIKESGFENRILFLGEVQQNDLPNLLRGCKALVALPRYEGYGLTPLEAMACGLPVIGSKTGHFEEFINSENENIACGKVVPIEDTQTASKEIVNLLSDPIQHSQFSQNAISTVTKKYNVTDEANAINQVYEQLWCGEIS